MVAMAHVGRTPSALSAGVSFARASGACERDGIHGAHVPLQSCHYQVPRGKAAGMEGKRLRSRLFGHMLEKYHGSDKELVRQVQVRVAAVNSASQSDAFKQCNKLGYHPLEDLSKLEKRQIELQQHGKLTDAELARTIADVNSNAILLAAFSTRLSVLGTEVQYLFDERGEFYFGIDNDNEFVRNITSVPTCSVIIGLEDIDDIMLSDIFSTNNHELATERDTNEESEDEDDELSEDWDFLMLDDDDEDDEEEDDEDILSSSESWGGFKTLHNIHPMSFASKISENITRDPAVLMYKPSRRLKLTGIIRQVTKEEDSYISKLWNDRYTSDDDEDYSEDEEEDKEERRTLSGAIVVENLEVVDDASSNTRDIETVTKGNLAPIIDMEVVIENITTTEVSVGSSLLDGKTQLERMSSSEAETTLEANINAEIPSTQASSAPHSADATPEGPTVLSEWHEDDEPGTSFYKLEIFSIELATNLGIQSSVDIKDFLYAKPDILGHDSANLVDQMNTSGKKFQNALKSLCQREKGIQAEEALVVGIDSLGVDVRASFGIEIQNVRFPFPKRAKCADSAEKLLNQLLYPRSVARSNRKARRMKG